jgi:hypothetical protein
VSLEQLDECFHRAGGMPYGQYDRLRFRLQFLRLHKAL